MKSLRYLLVLFALAPVVGAAATPPAAPAAAPAEHPPEWAELFGGAALPVGWQSAEAARVKIDAAVQARSFDGIAAWAETIHLAAHALDDQVKLDDPERQRRLTGALVQAARLADEVLDAARHREAEKLGEAFRRLTSALKLAALRLPAEVVNAPPQPVRFVPPSAGDQSVPARK